VTANLVGHKRTFRDAQVMPALLPKADIDERKCHVRFVPKADMPTVSALREAADRPRHGLRISFSISVVG
jgi:hypothetical protein